MHQDFSDTEHHAQHDLTLIAGLAADDLVTSDRVRATAQRDGCTECAALHEDLLAIALATRLLPAVPAPRDFRVTAEQAARLRRTGWMARVLAPFAGARSAARPLAAAFTTLGLAGAFVATVLPGILGATALSGAPGAAPAPEAAGAPGNAGPVASAAPGLQFGPAATTGSEDEPITKDATQATDQPVGAQAVGGADGRDLTSDGERLDERPTPPSPLLLGSLAFLAAGLVLFGLRFAARRLR